MLQRSQFSGFEFGLTEMCSFRWICARLESASLDKVPPAFVVVRRILAAL